MESVAVSILKRAVEEDQKKEYKTALVLYKEGVTILLKSIKESTDTVRQKHLSARASEYLDRAEKIKALLDSTHSSNTVTEPKETPKPDTELLKIEDGCIGYGYTTVFGKYLDDTVTEINIEDPYIRAFHQCQNLVRFCELAVRNCKKLTRICLVTTLDLDERKNQIGRLQELKQNLLARVISFEFTFSDTLHDRQITLSNGWVIKIGRGLDYFKAPDGKFVIGACDLELRPCLETTVHIFHQNQLKNTSN